MPKGPNGLAEVVVALHAEIAYLRVQAQQERDRYSALVAATMVRGPLQHSPVHHVPSLQPPGRTVHGALVAEAAPQGQIDLMIESIADGAPNPAAVRKSLALHVARLTARNASDAEILASLEAGADAPETDD